MTTATPSKHKAAGSRVSAAKSRTPKPATYLTESEKQMMDDLERAITKVTSSKEAATAFLKRAGIMDRTGNLAKIYRNA